MKSRRPIVVILVAAVMLAFLLLFWLSPAAVRRWLPGAPASLEIVNLCDSEWMIRVRRSPADRGQEWMIAPKETTVVTLPEGEYWIEQTLLGPREAGEDVRDFSMVLASGQTYRWKLLTLMGAGEGTGTAP